jgi:hypothetical protein
VSRRRFFCFDRVFEPCQAFRVSGFGVLSAGNAHTLSTGNAHTLSTGNAHTLSTGNAHTECRCVRASTALRIKVHSSTNQGTLVSPLQILHPEAVCTPNRALSGSTNHYSWTPPQFMRRAVDIHRASNTQTRTPEVEHSTSVKPALWGLGSGVWGSGFTP